MNSMTYRGYTARIEFDERDDLFWGKVLGLPDTVSLTFQGSTVSALRQDFAAAIADYLEDCREQGIEPLKPVKGKILLRLPPEVHGAVLVAAQSAGKSLNQWATEVLAQAAHR